MEWLKLFEREWPQIEMGLSLDGDPPSNAHRVDYRDRPTHERVERAFKLCHQLGRQIGVISVVTREALPRAREIIDYFSYFDAIRYLKFAPVSRFWGSLKGNARGESGIPYPPQSFRINNAWLGNLARRVRVLLDRCLQRMAGIQSL
jgi:uncharacterized protein